MVERSGGRIVSREQVDSPLCSFTLLDVKVVRDSRGRDGRRQRRWRAAGVRREVRVAALARTTPES